MTSFNHRVAIYYGFEGINNNPNGDPSNENKPRNYNGKVILTTDVSSKRDDRDYLAAINEKAIFLKQMQKEDGSIMQMNDMIKSVLKDKSFSHNQKVQFMLKRFIDIKFFGAAFTGKEKEEKKLLKEEDKDTKEESKGTASLKESVTGPVQKTFGISLNYPNILPVKITTVLATKEATVGTGSMGTKYVCDYYYIHYDVLVNPKSLAVWEVAFTEDDFQVLERTQWCSLKSDISHSKINREPVVMIEIFFKDDDFYFLPAKYVNSRKQKDVNSIQELDLDFTALAKKINAESSNIDKVEYKISNSLFDVFKRDLLDKISCTCQEIDFITPEKTKEVLLSYENYSI